jgi:hypothetical protein
MRRKAVIQHKPQEGRGVGVSELASAWHVHACPEPGCNLTYEDAGCADVNVNARPCLGCQGLERPIWERNRDPIDCCPGNTYLLTTKAERLEQRLAGPGPWFKCRTCRRAHPWPVTDERNA